MITLYVNVLGRSYDQSGLNYLLIQLNTAAKTSNKLLLFLLSQQKTDPSLQK
tara:strand:- start:4071 stop:4226 length:156 start_codon:yes stop_codon:yes gene_type:complete